MKPGYIYVLTHPSNSNLYKIGITTREPKQRLAEHNFDFTKPAGRIVKETGQRWELSEFHPVPDPYWAEKAFWGTTLFPDIPYRYGIEVEMMNFEEIQKGLHAAKRAGIRPDPAKTVLPDHVYAYTASMRKRLEGRDISLLGYVRSNSGKANFQCINGHQWRTTPMIVADGEGCPECGVGKRDLTEIMKDMNSGLVSLLIHPDKPGFIKIGITPDSLQEDFRASPYGDWEVHRHRNVEETALAETLIWELLGHPVPPDGGPIKIDLSVAEDAFRELTYAVREEIAFEERRKENLQKDNLNLSK